jgi:hypothetical protein
MNAKFLSTLLFLLGTGSALAAPQQPPRDRVTSDPNDPEKTRRVIPREERETLGLAPKTWSGVVHPDLYERLDHLKHTVANLKAKVDKQRDERAFATLSRIRFEGMVYVQVQLKPPTEGEDVQRRVLASLKASELHDPYLFKSGAGLTAYVTKECLDTLAVHPDVLGVCLDDKPLPSRGHIVAKDTLPPAEPGEGANEPGVAEKKVDPGVYRALASHDRVYVLVSLLRDSVPELGGASSGARTRLERRTRAVRELQARVLSTVSADDFAVTRRSTLGTGMSGYVTKAGLEKLWKHPELLRVSLPELRKVPERRDGTRFAP